MILIEITLLSSSLQSSDDLLNLVKHQAVVTVDEIWNDIRAL